MNRIPLSQIPTIKEAILSFNNYLKEAHQQASASPQPHYAFFGNSDALLWEMLQAYRSGAKVTWIQNKKKQTKPSPPLSIASNIIDTFFSEFLDIDLPEEEIKTLAENHPYRVWQAIKILNETDGDQDFSPSNDPSFKKQRSRLLHRLMNSLVKATPQDFSFHSGSVIELDNGEIKLIRRPNRIHPHVLITDDYPRLHVLPLKSDREPSLRYSDSKAAHHLMVQGTRYRDQITTALAEFEKVKPGSDAERSFEKEFAKRQARSRKKPIKVSIIGMGVGGLFAAIGAYQAGAQVTLIDKREHYTINNVFALPPAVIDKLIALFVDSKEDLKQLEATHPLRVLMKTKSLSAQRSSPLGYHHDISIRDFESLAATWLKVMAKKDPDGIKIYSGHRYIPNQKSEKNSEILVRPADYPDPCSDRASRDVSIPTEILIAADGYHSLCRKKCDIPVEYTSTAAPYATFTFHTERDEDNFLISHLENRRNPDPNFKPEHLSALGWERTDLPVFRYFPTGDHPYLGIDVPESLAQQYETRTQKIQEAIQQKDFQAAYNLRLERDAALGAWGQLNMLRILPQAEVDKLVLKDSSFFHVRLQRAKECVYQTCSGMQVIIIGDALHSAHFQTGRGAVSAIQDAEDCVDCLSKLMDGHSPDPMDELVAALENTALAVHQIAFNLGTNEDLKVKPITPAFNAYNGGSKAASLNQEKKGKKRKRI